MFKYIIVLFTAFSFIACQNDTSMEQAQQQDSMDEQMQPEFNQPQATDLELSDEEIERFVDAVVDAQEIQMESQQEMMEIVENEGISVEKYNQITQAQQMGQSEEEIDATSDELERYNRAMEQIREIEQRLEPEMVAAIENAGMDMERYQEINMAVQQDPALQQRIQQELQATSQMEQ